jgi:hypothetical protein
MRRTSRCLTILQTIGVEVATLLALFEIRTIVASGPLLSALGLAIAYIAFRRNRPLGLCFGLAAPTASVFCFSLIHGLDWGPDRARMPVLVILVVVALFHVAALYPVGCELAVERGDDREKVPFQFSIMSLLVLTTVVAIFFGTCKTFGLAGTAIGPLLTYGVIVAYSLRQFLVMRSERDEDGRGTGSSPFLAGGATPNDEGISR